MFQARRAGIFVVNGCQTNQAPFRSDIIGRYRPDGAKFVSDMGFYKDAAPTALVGSSRCDDRTAIFPKSVWHWNQKMLIGVRFKNEVDVFLPN